MLIIKYDHKNDVIRSLCTQKVTDYTCFRYSPDPALLKLQELAKKNQLGCIWSDVTKNYVLGKNQPDHQNDVILRSVHNFNRQQADSIGFPLKCMTSSEVVRLSPWHERSTKRHLESGGRRDYNEHQTLPDRLPYGFQIEMSLSL